MNKLLFIVTLIAVIGVTVLGSLAKAEDVKGQEAEIRNSYLNITSVNKKGDADLQRVKIDKCFLSIIRVNLGHHELPAKEDK